MHGSGFALAALVLGPIVASPGEAQGRYTRSATEVVEILVRESELPPPHEYMVFAVIAGEVRLDTYRARTDSLLRLLVTVARDNRRPMAQQRAVSLLGVSASSDVAVPRGWAGDAVVAMFSSLREPYVRVEAVRAFARLANGQLGDAVLTGLLTSDTMPARELFEIARAVENSGGRGQALLRELDRARAIRDPYVAGMVGRWVGQNFGRPRPPEDADLELFEAVLRHMLADSVRPELRVDPRPLRNDPRLATLHGIGMIPERLHPEAADTPLANVEREVIDARRHVLTGIQVEPTDAIRDARCPGIMKISARADSLKRELCPRARHRSVIVALARAGGAYWPGNVDERRKYGDTETASVRVIQRDVGPRGSVEVSADYVFSRSAGSHWTLMERRPLLIVE